MFLRRHSRVHFFPLIENGLLILANVLLLLGCIVEGGLLLPSKDCSPVATFDNAVISTPLNTSLTRTEFGHHGNLSRCLLECCNRTDCDMVMFDPYDMLCYGMLCSVNNVCHFGSPEVGQRSFQAALLGKIRKGKIIAQSTDIVASRETVQKEDLPKREGKLKLKVEVDRENKRDKRKAMEDMKMNTRKNNSLQKGDEKCGIQEMAQNVSLKSGMNAGNFKLHETVHNITSCTERCCEDPLCDIAVIMTNRCYTVQCYSPKDCESKESETPDIIIAYLDNHHRNNQNGTTPTTHINFNGDRKINKKTVIPNSSEGNIGDMLDSIQFLNGPSTVTKDMKFTFLQQCALYVEPENFTKTVHSWVTPRYSPVKYLYLAPTGKPPPLGMRSAVPLGGMGTGSLELRADGSIHEWTLENQSPGGSVKLGPGALDNAVLGVRVSSPMGSKASLLRTHPPPGYPGVEALSYSGSFPVTKLGVKNDSFFGLKIDLFAYGTLRPRQTDLSFVPGVAFTLSVGNPTKNDMNVSFLLNMPLGVQSATSRKGHDIATMTDVESSAQCAAMCNQHQQCLAWSYEKNNCSLKETMPPHAYSPDVTSGVKGRWETSGELLTCNRPGNFPNSGSTTMMSINSNKPSFSVTDDFRSVWDAFEKSGRLRKRIETSGFHGTISVSARLPAGVSETLTFILAWHYPNRDHSGETVGQYYSKLFNTSVDVAKHVRDNLLRNLKDIIAWQSNIIPPKSVPSFLQNHPMESSLPEWLQDHLVNSLSFWRSGFRVADGRWRQWEALDCNDVDSVHNDFQRELPYLIFFPELLENVVRAWAKYQHQGGWIQETLQFQWGCHNRTNQFDTPGGRIMADVTPAFLAQFYHLYLWTGNQKLLQDLWPVARKALFWLMRESTGGSSLPLRKTCTYDIIYLEGYDHTTYNSVMYLLGLRVGKVLANTVGEKKLAHTIQTAFNDGKAKIDETLWDDKKGFYHAWWDHEKGSPDWLMSDSLYGQVWAYALGLGNLLDPDKMKRHLQKEKQLNDTPYGLRALTQGTAVRKMQMKMLRMKKKKRSKRKINEKDAVANLDSFFTEVSGLQKKTYIEDKSLYTKNLSEHKIPRAKITAQAHNLTRGNLGGGTAEMKTLVKSVDREIKISFGNEGPQTANANISADKSRRSSGIHQFASVIQKTLNHKNCSALEEESKFNSIWMGSDSDWTTLNIHLGMDPFESLKQAEKALDHYRTKLNDLWNIHGLTAGQGYGLDGQPWCTSHYSFHLVLWHIPLALSGQRYDAVRKQLTFEPKLSVPYALPFFTPIGSGIVKAGMFNRRVKYTVIVTSGRLDVKVLAVSKSLLPRGRTNLGQGGYVTWERQ